VEVVGHLRVSVGVSIRQNRLRIDRRRAVKADAGVSFFMIVSTAANSGPPPGRRIAYRARTMRKLQISQWLTLKSVPFAVVKEGQRHYDDDATQGSSSIAVSSLCRRAEAELVGRSLGNFSASPAYDRPRQALADMARLD
jgi:hypothetical protein